MRRVYVVSVPLHGSGDPFPLAECNDANAAIEVAKSLLLAWGKAGTDSSIIIRTEMRVVPPR